MKRILLILIIIIFVHEASALNITGLVNDALDGQSADGKIIVLWNPAFGTNDNVTDIIGLGNSLISNTYLIDCSLLNNGCSIGDQLRAKVIDSGDGYVTSEASLIVNGSNNVMPNLTLNSPPSITLNFPDFANVSSPFQLSCIAEDPDANLANVTLYADWNGSWSIVSVNQASGNHSESNFTQTATEGTYEWACLAMDELSITKISQNFTLNVDNTLPAIDLAINLTSQVCGLENIARINCTASDAFTGVQNVLVNYIAPNGTSANITAQNIGDTYFADISLNSLGEWEFSCYAEDFSNNINSQTEILNVYPENADIQIEDLEFSSNQPIENQQLSISAIVNNNGCSQSGDFITGIYLGDPSLGGTQLSNQTLDLQGLENGNLNFTWNAQIGTSNIFILADIENLIVEENETDNKLNKEINVGAWQEFYGNVNVDLLLSNFGLSNVSVWFNDSLSSGNIFVTDSESDISWSSLIAIGKDSNLDDSLDDFSEIDLLLNMDDLEDSVSNVFTSDGSTPINLFDFNIYDNDVLNIPIVNSINNSNFVTGILWDSSDDTDGQYSQDDREDLVFVSQINKQKQGAYGTYDYEIKIPARLRQYQTTDTENIYFYFDLN